MTLWLAPVLVVAVVLVLAAGVGFVVLSCLPYLLDFEPSTDGQPSAPTLRRQHESR